MLYTVYGIPYMIHGKIKLSGIIPSYSTLEPIDDAFWQASVSSPRFDCVSVQDESDLISLNAI